MPHSAQEFVDATVSKLKPLTIARNLAEWDAATTGASDALDRAARTQADLMRFLSSPEAHAEVRALHESNIDDPLLARQVKLTYLAYAENQQDEETLEALAQLEGEVREAFTNFRGQLPSGRSVNDNEIEDVLRHSTSSAEAREAWEASKQIGERVAETIREMARLRNQSARRQGFRDHFARSLALTEIDEAELFRIFGHLEQASNGPFAKLKAELDSKLAAKFGLPESELRPWHYGNRWFQEPPKVAEVDSDRYFEGKDPVGLAVRTYDGLGMQVGAILERSDLYPRDGKDQHAFCTDIDREGDIRTLNNLQPNERWASTLLHELGHGVHAQYMDRGLPWMVRTIPHLLSTEAIALLMGALVHDREWLTRVLGVPAADADRLAAAAREKSRWQELIFTRWVLVMTHFERLMYADPERDLNTTWWDMVERYQLLRRPEGRNAPDWGSKIHLGLYPVYYHNYELGNLVRSQLRHGLNERFGGMVDRPAAGAFLIESVFSPGARTDWSEHVRLATGETLNPAYFVAEFS